MAERSPEEYKRLLTEVIKKQIVVLGPDITLAKARNVPGLVVANDGTVTSFSGNPSDVTQQLINQFMELSGLIVKKTMEPLLDGHEPAASAVATAVITPAVAPTQPAAVTPVPQTPQTGQAPHSEQAGMNVIAPPPAESPAPQPKADQPLAETPVVPPTEPTPPAPPVTEPPKPEVPPMPPVEEPKPEAPTQSGPVGMPTPGTPLVGGGH